MHGTLLVGVLGLFAVGGLKLVTLPADTFVANVIVDDAFYYTVPARNLLSGHAYSFDGEKRTNGVQPLWAVVAIVLVQLIPDELAVLRAMCLLSGLLWAIGGLILYRGLRRYDRWLALLVCAGWLLTAFWNRIAFQGMENGLHGMLCAMLVAFGMRRLRARNGITDSGSRGFYLILGLLLALLTLTRVDSGLLAPIMGGLVLLGLIRPDKPPRLALNLPGALLLALPGLILVGGYLWLNREYFGSTLPISGRVKLHLESGWEPLYGGPLGSLLWHVRFLFDVTTWPVARNLETTLWNVFSHPWPAKYPQRLFLVALALGLLCALLRLRAAQRESGRRPTAWHFYAAALAVFVAARFGFYALALAHFTPYCTWYFSPEIMTAWIVYGALLFCLGQSLVGWVQRLCGARRAAPLWAPRTLLACLVLVLITIGALPIASPPARDVRTSQFLVASRWIQRNLPARSKIGAWSAGILGWFARDQQVVNLDGLMNDREYFENYLKPGRCAEYARDRGLHFIADYAPLSSWRAGGVWGIETAGLQLVRWWRMDGDLGYCIWRFSDDSQPRDTLDPCEGFCDRLSQFQYAAEVEGRFPLIPDSDLGNYLARPESGRERVFATIVVHPSLELKHLVLPDEEAEALELRPEQVDIRTPRQAVFGDVVQLLGVDIPQTSVRRGGRLVMTRYWQRIGEAGNDVDVSFETWIQPAHPANYDLAPPRERILHKTRACYGTHPLREWRAGELVVETYAILIPSDAPAGSYPVNLALWDPRRGWLLPDTAGASAERPTFLVANIEIR